MTSAQGHHPDCDGYRTAHRVTFTEDRTCYRAECAECGPLHVDLFGQRADCERQYASHACEVPCDGRCREWAQLVPENGQEARDAA